MRPRLLAASALVLAAAAGAVQAQNLTQRFICADGSAFFARPQPQAVVLDFGGGRAETLPSDPQAGFGVYRQGADEFRLTAEGASFARGGRPPSACRALDVHDLPLPPFE